MFKIKPRFKFELETLETMKLFGNVKHLIDKAKNGEKIQNLEAVEVASVQCN